MSDVNNSESSGRVTLSTPEMQLAIQAIGAQAYGKPVQAAESLLAGIAVLRGQHAPFVVWPESLSELKDQAAWHTKQATEIEERIAWGEAFVLRNQLSRASQEPAKAIGGERAAPLADDEHP